MKIFGRESNQILCPGNGNKYNSEEECQKACPKEFLQADICQLPKETGPCFDLVERYYFDFQMGTCQRFEFGGCEGKHWFLHPVFLSPDLIWIVLDVCCAR